MTSKAAFRLEASPALGTGHLMRCLVLADELRRRHWDVLFLSRDPPSEWSARLRGRPGFAWETLAGPDADGRDSRAALAGTLGTADWLIVDHYGLDEGWERRMTSRAERLLVLDDLANRSHYCHLLLDPNLRKEKENPYEGLVPAGTPVLLGPSHALLRPEFSAAGAARPRSGRVRQVLVNFGGSDPGDDCRKAVLALDRVRKERGEKGHGAEAGSEPFEIEVVAGLSNPKAEALAGLCARIPHCRFLRHTDAMATAMERADLALGAGGTTTWERCRMGLPALAWAAAPNQEGGLEAAAAAGALVYLGGSGAVTVGKVAEALADLLAHPQRLRQMGERAFSLLEETAPDPGGGARGLRRSAAERLADRMEAAPASRRIPEKDDMLSTRQVAALRPAP